jgi:hypothetical protein
MSDRCYANGPQPLSYLQNPFESISEQQRMERELADFRRDEGMAAAKNLAVQGAGERTAVDHSDVIQGSHADCFLVAAMAAVTLAHPDPDRWLRDMVKVNDDGSFTVTFRVFNPGDPLNGVPPSWDKPLEQTVFVDELSKPAHSDEAREMWPAIVERAYAKAFPEAQVAAKAAQDPYGFGGGSSGMAMARLTGQMSESVPVGSMDIRAFADYQAKGYALTAGTFADPTAGLDPLQVPNWHPAYQPGGLGMPDTSPAPLKPDTNHQGYNESLRPWHVYYVSNVDVSSGTVTLHNVWDTKREDIRMPYDDFQSAFNDVQANPMRARDTH